MLANLVAASLGSEEAAERANQRHKRLCDIDDTARSHLAELQTRAQLMAREE